jgi:5-formyltetrahydrofolate cyclo-ligase
MTSSSRAELRKHFREQRRALSWHEQDKHARALAHLLSKHSLFRNARRIACYLPEDGEIDTTYIIDMAWRFKKELFLPVLPPTGQSLFFAPYTPQSLLRPNRFNIDEPVCSPRHWLRARQLNLILLPLVAFDAQGNRLGMGGGYYDRSLAFTRHRQQWHSPHLIGLAHDLQKAPQLPCESWDIPLNIIATETRLYSFNAEKKS